MKKLFFLITFFCICNMQAYSERIADSPNEVVIVTINVTIRNPQTVTVEFPSGYKISRAVPLDDLCTILNGSDRTLRFLFSRGIGFPNNRFENGVFVYGTKNGVPYTYHIMLNYVKTGESGGGSSFLPITVN